MKAIDRLFDGGEYDDYLEAFSRTPDIEAAYKATHKTKHLSRDELSERATKYFLEVFGDVLRERWEEQEKMFRGGSKK